MNFQPLLAATCEDLSALRYPVLVSPKLDGIRCVKLGGQALTRKLKPVPNHHVRSWVESHLPDGLDGELMLRDHRTPFGDVSSAIMSRDGEPDFVFYAFDVIAGGPFAERYGRLSQVSFLDRFGVVPHETAETADELRAVVVRHLDLGYEGTMVRDPEGRYKYGRSTLREQILVKIKPHVDEEATVVGAVELMHNTNPQERDERGYAKRSKAKAGLVGTGKLGALVCVTADGVRFEVGTGFTDAQRVELWERSAIGHVVKFRHLGRTRDGVPRGPVFLGWRYD